MTIDGLPRVFDGDDLPVCLGGDRLMFFSECFPTIWTGETMIERHETTGSSWDGASMPRWASYWHDRLCESAQCIEDRTIADAVFLRLLKAAGVPRWRRLAMWAAVRCYGIFLWRAK